MKLHRILLVFLFFQIYTEVKAQWTLKHLDEKEYTWNNLVKFKNDSLGLFMGSNSVILKSRDAGETWNAVHLKAKINLFDFQFVGDSTVFAIGLVSGGTQFIKSLDNGDNWESIASFPGKQLWSLFFFDAKTGVLAGYDGIYRTSDSGNTWDLVWSIPLFGYRFGELKQICFPTSQIGFAVGTGYPEFGMGDHIFLKTTDSGINWATVCTFKQDLTSVCFLNADIGFVGTEPGILYKTVNGGLTWSEKIITEFWNEISSIQFISDKIGFVVGHQRALTTGGGSSTSFFISKTIDGGETWKTFGSNGIPLNSIYFINATTGFVSGEFSLIMKTTGKINELPADYPWHLVQYGSSGKGIDDSNTFVKVFPNPTIGPLTLQLKNSDQTIETIRLLSSLGQIIYIGNPILNSEDIQIDLSRLISGIYFLQIGFSNKIELIKVLKK